MPAGSRVAAAVSSFRTDAATRRCGSHTRAGTRQGGSAAEASDPRFANLAHPDHRWGAEVRKASRSARCFLLAEAPPSANSPRDASATSALLVASRSSSDAVWCRRDATVPPVARTPCRCTRRRVAMYRRTVRQALVSAVPPERKRPVGRPAPALGAWREWIDQILIANEAAPRKQRHTAKRIADRLAEEHGVVVAGSTMRDHVRKRRRALGPAAEAFREQVASASSISFAIVGSLAIS